MHFDGIESSKIVMKDLTIQKIINLAISVWFNFWPFGYLKFVLKCFELILFNGPFMILLVRFTVMSRTSEQKEYAWCLHQPNLIYSDVLNVKTYPE